MSSVQLDQQEVKDIAAELKKDLAVPLAGHESVPTQTAPQEPAPAGVEPSASEMSQPEDVAAKLQGGDTIYIDNEGNIHQGQPEDPHT